MPEQAAYEATRHLNFKDLAVNSLVAPTLIRIRLKFSKTDQLGRGTDVFLGRTNDDLCPVAATLAYLAVRGDGEGPFMFTDGRYLTKERFTGAVRAALEEIGLHSANYTSHSFRIGAATTAAQIGVEDSTIQALGRWSSDAFKKYVQPPKDFLAQLSASLSGPEIQPAT